MDQRDLDILKQLFPDQRTEAVVTMLNGRKRFAYYGRVRRWNKSEKRMELVVKCNEKEFHHHRTAEAAIKCAEKAARNAR